MIICFNCGSEKVSTVYNDSIFLCSECWSKQIAKDKKEIGKGYY